MDKLRPGKEFGKWDKLVEQLHSTRNTSNRAGFGIWIWKPKETGYQRWKNLEISLELKPNQINTLKKLETKGAFGDHLATLLDKPSAKSCGTPPSVPDELVLINVEGEIDCEVAKNSGWYSENLVKAFAPHGNKEQHLPVEQVSAHHGGKMP